MEDEFEDQQDEVTAPAPRRRDTLSRAEIINVMRQAGWDEDLIPMYSAVAMAESSGRTGVKATRVPKLDGTMSDEESYGLFQINMKGRLGADRRRRFGITEEDLKDPLVNARIAKQIYDEQGWKAWYTTIQGGKYKNYLNEADLERADAIGPYQGGGGTGDYAVPPIPVSYVPGSGLPEPPKPEAGVQQPISEQTPATPEQPQVAPTEPTTPFAVSPRRRQTTRQDLYMAPALQPPRTDIPELPKEDLRGGLTYTPPTVMYGATGEQPPTPGTAPQGTAPQAPGAVPQAPGVTPQVPPTAEAPLTAQAPTAQAPKAPGVTPPPVAKPPAVTPPDARAPRGQTIRDSRGNLYQLSQDQSGVGKGEQRWELIDGPSARSATVDRPGYETFIRRGQGLASEEMLNAEKRAAQQYEAFDRDIAQRVGAGFVVRTGGTALTPSHLLKLSEGNRALRKRVEELLKAKGAAPDVGMTDLQRRLQGERRIDIPYTLQAALELNRRGVKFGDVDPERLIQQQINQGKIKFGKDGVMTIGSNEVSSMLGATRPKRLAAANRAIRQIENNAQGNTADFWDDVEAEVGLGFSQDPRLAVAVDIRERNRPVDEATARGRFEEFQPAIQKAAQEAERASVSPQAAQAFSKQIDVSQFRNLPEQHRKAIFEMIGAWRAGAVNLTDLQTRIGGIKAEGEQIYNTARNRLINPSEVPDFQEKAARWKRVPTDEEVQAEIRRTSPILSEQERQDIVKQFATEKGGFWTSWLGRGLLQSGENSASFLMGMLGDDIIPTQLAESFKARLEVSRARNEGLSMRSDKSFWGDLAAIGVTALADTPRYLLLGPTGAGLRLPAMFAAESMLIAKGQGLSEEEVLKAGATGVATGSAFWGAGKIAGELVKGLRQLATPKINLTTEAGMRSFQQQVRNYAAKNPEFAKRLRDVLAVIQAGRGGGRPTTALARKGVDEVTEAELRLFSTIFKEGDAKFFRTPAQVGWAIAQKVAPPLVEVGAIYGSVKGIQQIAGASPEQAEDEAIKMAMLHIAMSYGGRGLNVAGAKLKEGYDRLKGKFYRVWANGRPVDVVIDPDGTIHKATRPVDNRILEAEIRRPGDAKGLLGPAPGEAPPAPTGQVPPPSSGAPTPQGAVPATTPGLPAPGTIVKKAFLEVPPGKRTKKNPELIIRDGEVFVDTDGITKVRFEGPDGTRVENLTERNFAPGAIDEANPQMGRWFGEPAPVEAAPTEAAPVEAAPATAAEPPAETAPPEVTTPPGAVPPPGEAPVVPAPGEAPVAPAPAEAPAVPAPAEPTAPQAPAQTTGAQFTTLKDLDKAVKALKDGGRTNAETLSTMYSNLTTLSQGAAPGSPEAQVAKAVKAKLDTKLSQLVRTQLAIAKLVDGLVKNAPTPMTRAEAIEAIREAAKDADVLIETRPAQAVAQLIKSDSALTRMMGARETASFKKLTQLLASPDTPSFSELIEPSLQWVASQPDTTVTSPAGKKKGKKEEVEAKEVVEAQPSEEASAPQEPAQPAKKATPKKEEEAVSVKEPSGVAYSTIKVGLPDGKTPAQTLPTKVTFPATKDVPDVVISKGTDKEVSLRDEASMLTTAIKEGIKEYNNVIKLYNQSLTKPVTVGGREVSTEDLAKLAREYGTGIRDRIRNLGLVEQGRRPASENLRATQAPKGTEVSTKAKKVEETEAVTEQAEKEAAAKDIIARAPQGGKVEAELPATTKINLVAVPGATPKVGDTVYKPFAYAPEGYFEGKVIKSRTGDKTPDVVFVNPRTGRKTRLPLSEQWSVNKPVPEGEAPVAKAEAKPAKKAGKAKEVAKTPYDQVKDSIFGGQPANKNREFLAELGTTGKGLGRTDRADVMWGTENATFWLSEGPDGVIVIDDFQVAKPALGQGFGRTALTTLVERAKASGITLIGDPLAAVARGKGSKKGLSQKDLLAFYKRAGFDRISPATLKTVLASELAEPTKTWIEYSPTAKAAPLAPKAPTAMETLGDKEVVHWTSADNLKSIFEAGAIKGGSLTTSLDLPFDIDNKLPYGIVLDRDVVTKLGFKNLPKNTKGVTAAELAFELRGKKDIALTDAQVAFVTRSKKAADALRKVLDKAGLTDAEIRIAGKPKLTTLEKPAEEGVTKPTETKPAKKKKAEVKKKEEVEPTPNDVVQVSPKQRQAFDKLLDAVAEKQLAYVDGQTRGASDKELNKMLEDMTRAYDAAMAYADKLGLNIGDVTGGLDAARRRLEATRPAEEAAPKEIQEAEVVTVEEVKPKDPVQEQVELMDPNLKAAIRTDMENGLLPTEVAQNRGIPLKVIEAIRPKGPLGPFGQAPYKLRERMKSQMTDFLEDLVKALEPRTDISDRKVAADVIMDKMAELIGKSRSSALDRNDYERILRELLPKVKESTGMMMLADLAYQSNYSKAVRDLQYNPQWRALVEEARDGFYAKWDDLPIQTKTDLIGIAEAVGEPYGPRIDKAGNLANLFTPKAIARVFDETLARRRRPLFDDSVPEGVIQQLDAKVGQIVDGTFDKAEAARPHKNFTERADGTLTPIKSTTFVGTSASPAAQQRKLEAMVYTKDLTPAQRDTLSADFVKYNAEWAALTKYAGGAKQVMLNTRWKLQEDGVIAVNTEGMSFINFVLYDNPIVANGLYAFGGRRDGSSLIERLEDTSRHLEYSLTNAKEMGLTPTKIAETRAMKQIVDGLYADVQAARASSPFADVVIIRDSPNAPLATWAVLQEELGHRADFRTRMPESVPGDAEGLRLAFDVDTMMKTPGFSKAFDNLRKTSYGAYSKNAIASEVVAKAFRPDAETELGITSDERWGIIGAYSRFLVDNGVTPDFVHRNFSRISSRADEFTKLYAEQYERKYPPGTKRRRQVATSVDDAGIQRIWRERRGAYEGATPVPAEYKPKYSTRKTKEGTEVVISTPRLKGREIERVVRADGQYLRTPKGPEIKLNREEIHAIQTAPYEGRYTIEDLIYTTNVSKSKGEVTIGGKKYTFQGGELASLTKPPIQRVVVQNIARGLSMTARGGWMVTKGVWDFWGGTKRQVVASTDLSSFRQTAKLIAGSKPVIRVLKESGREAMRINKALDKEIAQIDRQLANIDAALLDPARLQALGVTRNTALSLRDQLADKKKEFAKNKIVIDKSMTELQFRLLLTSHIGATLGGLKREGWGEGAVSKMPALARKQFAQFGGKIPGAADYEAAMHNDPNYELFKKIGIDYGAATRPEPGMEVTNGWNTGRVVLDVTTRRVQVPKLDANGNRVDVWQEYKVETKNVLLPNGKKVPLTSDWRVTGATASTSNDLFGKGLFGLAPIFESHYGKRTLKEALASKNPVNIVGYFANRLRSKNPLALGILMSQQSYDTSIAWVRHKEMTARLEDLRAKYALEGKDILDDYEALRRTAEFINRSSGSFSGDPNTPVGRALNKFVIPAGNQFMFSARWQASNMSQFALAQYFSDKVPYHVRMATIGSMLQRTGLFALFMTMMGLLTDVDIVAKNPADPGFARIRIPGYSIDVSFGVVRLMIMGARFIDDTMNYINWNYPDWAGNAVKLTSGAIGFQALKDVDFKFDDPFEAEYPGQKIRKPTHPLSALKWRLEDFLIKAADPRTQDILAGVRGKTALGSPTSFWEHFFSTWTPLSADAIITALTVPGAWASYSMLDIIGVQATELETPEAILDLRNADMEKFKDAPEEERAEREKAWEDRYNFAVREDERRRFPDNPANSKSWWRRTFNTMEEEEFINPPE